MNEWVEKEAVTWWAKIYVGGDFVGAKEVCRKFCFPSGLCVNIRPIDFVFAGGAEAGVEVGLMQYPRFPEQENVLELKAISLGKAIAEKNTQWTFLVMLRQTTAWFSRKANNEQ